VQAPGEASELDLLLRKSEPTGGPSYQLSHALGVAPGVHVASIDCAGQAGGCSEASRAVGAAGEPLQLRELDHVGPVGADAVLAVLLGPVERAVREPDQLVAVVRVLGRGCDADADRDGLDLLELQRRDPLDY